LVDHGSKYDAIKYVNETLHLPISFLCDILKFNRSSYYKFLNKMPTENDQVNEQILIEIQHIHENVKGIYGYRRMTMNINRKLNRTYNNKRIRRLMKLHKIESVIRRKKKKYVRSNPQHVAENILGRNFSSNSPNEKWLTDVTEFKYGNGKKAYLSTILDLYDNSIVAYTLGHSNNNSLVFLNFDIALKALGDSKPLVHSDRGYQVRQEVA